MITRSKKLWRNCRTCRACPVCLRFRGCLACLACLARAQERNRKRKRRTKRRARLKVVFSFLLFFEFSTCIARRRAFSFFFSSLYMIEDTQLLDTWCLWWPISGMSDGPGRSFMATRWPLLMYNSQKPHIESYMTQVVRLFLQILRKYPMKDYYEDFVFF